MHESNRRFLNNRLFQYMLPGFIMAVMLDLWKVVDTILTGVIDGTDAMSAIVLSLPVETLIQIPGFCLGIGGSIIAGRMLGARNNKGASQVMTYTVIIVAAIGLMFSVVSFFLAKPIALGLSGGGELFEDTYYFIFINMLGAPVIGLGLLMTGYLSLEKNEKISTAYLLTANLLNFILDVMSLKFTHLGVKGAAMATVLGFMFSLAIFVPYIVAPGSQLKFIKPDKSVRLDPIIKMSKGAIGEMSLDFITELGMSLVIIYAIGSWGMPAFAICRNILLLTGILIAGCISIVPSLTKVMKKEYDFRSIRKLCNITLIMAAVICVVVTVLTYVLADALVELYAIEGELFVSLEYYMGILIHIFIVCLPAYVWNRFFASYYEALGQKKYSEFISVLSGGILVIPCVIMGILIGKDFGGSGIYGLALGYVISEITILGLSFLYRRLKLKSKTVLMVPRENPGTSLDLSIKAEMENTPSIPEKVMQFCKENKIKKRICIFAAVAAEEMAVNSIKFGGKDSEWVDICLVVNDDKLTMRLRDKGVPFNPTEYEFDGDKFDISGIRLVKLVSSRISYMRLVNMNNTVIEFDNIR